MANLKYVNHLILPRKLTTVNVMFYQIAFLMLLRISLYAVDLN
jgi:hypothetical protein